MTQELNTKKLHPEEQVPLPKKDTAVTETEADKPETPATEHASGQTSGGAVQPIQSGNQSRAAEQGDLRK